MRPRSAYEPSFLDKSAMDQPAKAAIAAAAASLLRDGSTVYLDAGTTCLALVPHLLEHRGMTVVTNDFNAAEALMSGGGDIETIHTGGVIDRANRSSVGRLAARTVSELAVDTAFVSTSSWDLPHGVTTPSEPKVAVKQAVMTTAARTVLLAGSAKYGAFGRYRVAALSAFHRVITDSGLPTETRTTLANSGVDLTTAPDTQ